MFSCSATRRRSRVDRIIFSRRCRVRVVARLYTHLNILYARRQYAWAHTSGRRKRVASRARVELRRADTPLVFDFLEKRVATPPWRSSITYIKVVLWPNHAAQNRWDVIKTHWFFFTTETLNEWETVTKRKDALWLRKLNLKRLNRRFRLNCLKSNIRRWNVKQSEHLFITVHK